MDKPKINLRVFNRQTFFEFLTWAVIVLATLFVVLYFPYSEAYSILLYILIGATFASTFWYLHSRRLYVLAEANAKKAKQRSRELMKQRQTAEIVFNQASDGILVIDDSRRILEFSAGLEKMTGFKREECLGKIADQVFEFRGDKTIPSILSVILSPRDYASKHYRIGRVINNSLKTANNKYIEVEIGFDNFKDPVTGTLLGLAILRDITLEKEIKERDRGFVAMASHQIFTPLSMVRGFIALILNPKNGKLNNKQKEYAKQIQSATRRIVALVMGLLSISRIEEGKINLDYKLTDLVKLTKDLVKELISTEQLRNNKIEFVTEQNTIFLELDQEKIGQAVNNCLDNALKYTDKGTIKVKLYKNKNMAILEIADNGIGIPETEIERIGTKFFRASNALSRDTHGTGLGMYVSRFMVDEHGGSLSISSKINQGTTITIKLPLKHNKKESNG